MAAGRPRIVDPQELYFFAQEFYWDFCGLAEGRTRWGFDKHKFDRTIAESEKKPLNKQERIMLLNQAENPYVERLIGSIRRDCLNHFVILNARHLKRTLASYFAYYHGSRTHLGLDKQCPFPRQVSSVGWIIEIPQLGGLHHRYERVAA